MTNEEVTEEIKKYISTTNNISDLRKLANEILNNVSNYDKVLIYHEYVEAK